MTSDQHTQATMMGIYQQRADSWASLPVLLVVDDHIGGGDNHGWYMARYAVEGCFDYEDYQWELHRRLEKQHGDIITVYRSARKDWALDEMEDPEMYLSTTTSKDFAIHWSTLPMNEGHDRVLIEMQVLVDSVVFEGHAGEFELVVASPPLGWKLIKEATDD